jgi:hypothetical protein
MAALALPLKDRPDLPVIADRLFGRGISHRDTEAQRRHKTDPNHFQTLSLLSSLCLCVFVV